MFNEDLQLGKRIEEEFADILISKGKKVLMTYGRNKDFDIATYEDDIIICTWEVKFDILFEKTGNIAIEYECNGQKSGLSATKAKYWVIATSKSFYIINTNKLKDYLKITWHDLTKKQNKNAKFILLKLNYLLNITEKIYDRS